MKEKVASAPATAKRAARRARTEEDVFAALGLHFFPPELRVGLGEMEAAEKGELPRLVKKGDLRGAFHNHTTASDGHNTLAEMATAAETLELGIPRHLGPLQVQPAGQGPDRRAAPLSQIREIGRSTPRAALAPHLFAGVECDILTDGRLDYADDILCFQLDYVVVSVHNAMAQSEEIMTARIIRAVEELRTPPCSAI